MIIQGFLMFNMNFLEELVSINPSDAEAPFVQSKGCKDV